MRMSYKEFCTWAQYRFDRGSLNVGRRVEQAVGHLTYITSLVNSSKGSKIKPLDFMPHEPKEKVAEMSDQEAFKLFAGL